MSKFLFAIFLVTVQYVRGYQIVITKRQAVLKPTVTITDYTPFRYLRTCEQSILSKNDWMGGRALGCSFPFDNSCYCNTAKRAVASSYISSCVFTYCSDYDFDYTAAVSVYDQYCGDVAAGITPRFHDTPLTETVTITDMREWSGLGTCGQQILSKNDWLKQGLKCPSPWFNSCYCDRNLAPLATSYISSCIFTYCSTLSADFDEALDVYNSYCASTRVKGAAQPTSTGTGRFTTSKPAKYKLLLAD